jgi:preprotein translocase subunit SecD
MRIGKLLRSGNVIFYLVVMATAILLIASLGIKTGLDLSGGTLVKLELDHVVDDKTMGEMTRILQTRLDTLGVVGVSVRPWGKDKILVEVAGIDPQREETVTKILSEQGVYEAFIDGILSIKGNEVVRVDPERITGGLSGYKWEVPFVISSDAGVHFAEVATGKKDHPVDMFLDRPANSLLVLSQKVYDVFTAKPEGLALPLKDRVGTDIYFLVVADSLTPENVATLESLKGEIVKVLIIGDDTYVSTAVEKQLRDRGLRVERIVDERKIEAGKKYDETYLRTITGLLDSPTLNIENPDPKSVEYVVEGGAQSRDDAIQQAERIKTILRSGALPVATAIGGKSVISPTLGSEFVRQMLIAGGAALILVSFIISFRYKHWNITIPIIITAISEATIVLGIAALIHWSMDLPSIAGIIAAIGTGVNDQIIITDEVLAGDVEKERRKSVGKKVQSAFFIVFSAAATIVTSMTPLAYMGLGSLKGFAITTILGVFAGIFVTRPAYGRTIEFLMKEEKKK